MMKCVSVIAAVLMIGVLSSLPVHAVGFTRVAPSSGQSFDLGIWYPSDAAGPSSPNTPFGQALAIDAAPTGSRLPLVIVSHGNAGWMGGHANTARALAEAGYVVAAPTHSDDNTENDTVDASVWLKSRPREVIATIDFMLERWSGADRIAPGSIGVFGFSAGGYSVLAAAGVALDPVRARRHCRRQAAEFVCRIGLIDDVLSSDANDNLVDLAADPRIRAISVAAPGFGFALGIDSMQALELPVQIWSGAFDERVPHASNGHVIAESVKGPVEVNIVDDAGHFAFLPPCRAALEAHNPRIWAMICVDTDGFDRKAFHERFNAELAGFFDRTLNIHQR